MDFDRLRAFVWTLEEGGISAAARRLYRTQPAVTRMIQTLEDQVGAELIDRRARPLQPTAAGRRLLTDAYLILQAADRMVDGSIASKEGRQMLRLGLSRSLLWALRGRAFLKLQSPLSKIDFVVRSGWSPRLYRRFVRGEFDCAVVLMPPDWSPEVDCQATRLRSESLVLIGPLDAERPPTVHVDAARLGAQRWILNPDGCGFRKALGSLLESAGQTMRVHFELDAAPHEHLSMVAAGLGASVVPQSTLVEYADMAKRVQQLQVDGGAFELHVWMLWAAQYKGSPSSPVALAEVFARPVADV